MENKIKKIYTIATAHLDTSWLWTFEQTISDFIPNTLHQNFELMEKIPEYKFNFEGSYRYELTEEYYPEDFKKLTEYIKEGRWNPCGACYENGDVNVPSPEALIRNILYGNGYFLEKFGVESNDIFLPDCFGFGRALPSIAAHSGLTGFSTQKLSWGGAVDVPFDIGRWTGKDGKGVWTALKPGAYSKTLFSVRKNANALKNLTENISKYDLAKTFIYHGTGDRGGSPSEFSVKNTVKEIRKNSSKDIKVTSATTREFFDDMESLSSEEKKKLPVWDSEFLMSEHGTGSYTSRAVSKRWNRRSELLADAAERFASAAFVSGLADYPQYVFDNGWKKVIAHQFHDDITGTSFEECYKRNWNDYVQAMNSFSTEYTAASKSLASQMDTSFVKGIPVVVSNPNQGSKKRTQAANVILENELSAEFIKVYDAKGKEVPSQTSKTAKGKVLVTFLADVESCGMEVYDIRSSDEPSSIMTELSVSESSIENKNYIVKIDKNGDISSIFDKRLSREILKAPIRMAIHSDVYSFDWPAWEIKYKDISSTPYMYAEKPSIKIIENGPALCALEITRKAGTSVFKQIISLDAESEFISVSNETDWREEASLLKAEFPLAAENENASYDIGIGYTSRPTNTPRLFEVPAQKWADITDKNGSFGVSVFSDSRSGWDKPDSSTLRLTCVHTPLSSYRWECSQHLLDMGLNRYSFGICSHSAGPDNVASLADDFCQPLHTFITDKHSGSLGSSYSFASVNNDTVRVMAIKKAQKSDKIILRVAEYTGKEQENIEIAFALPIAKAFEVSGDEKEISEIPVKDGKLQFNLNKSEIKSFALTFDNKEADKKSVQKQIDLPYNAIAVTDNKNRRVSTLPDSVSLPEEIMPDKVLCGGVNYNLIKNGNSAVICKGQEIELPENSTSLHLLLTSLKGDRQAEFTVGESKHAVTVQDCFEAVGAWDLLGLKETGYIKEVPQMLTISHIHKPDGDVIAKQFYIFHAEIPLGKARSITLPKDENILIFAATTETGNYHFTKADEHFDRLEKRAFDYTISKYAKNHASPLKLEKLLDKLTNRTTCANLRILNFNMVQSVGEIYYMMRMVGDVILTSTRRNGIKRKRNMK